jgi:hypothetical protein
MRARRKSGFFSEEKLTGKVIVVPPSIDVKAKFFFQFIRKTNYVGVIETQ